MLEQTAFRNRTAALLNLERALDSLPDSVRTQTQALLSSSADTDSALYYLDNLQSRRPDAFFRLINSPICLQYTITVFSYSRFLSEEILQHPEWIEELPETGEVHRILLMEEFAERLESFLEISELPSPLSLALFRRKQLLRILLRDVLGFATLANIAAELSNLADAILDVTLRRIRQSLYPKYGVPRYLDDAGQFVECGFTVLALGKLGGEELNYSSDIDLMFLYSANGETDGPVCISNKEFYKKVSNSYTDILSTYTAAGLCYRVDLRLRPEGRLGEVCLSLDGAKSYYRNRARDWELQMLIKARPAAGDLDLGRELLDFVEPVTYSTTLDFSAVESVSVTRERIHEKLAAKRGSSGIDVKLAAGGIRDIEFLVQCLQRLHGGREAWVRHGGTLLALSRLYDKELLSDSEYSRLFSAYIFLRHLEHRLQFDEDRQTHTLPQAPKTLEILARRMPAECLGTERTAEHLRRELNTHLEEVQEIYQRVIHAQKPSYYSPATCTAGDSPEFSLSLFPEQPSNLVRFLDQKAPNLARHISKVNLVRGVGALEHFLERIDNQPDRLQWLDEDRVLTNYVLDLLEHSPYLSEQLIRKPEMLEEIHGFRHRPEADLRYQDTVLIIHDANELRRFFRREVFRLQAQSICLHVPIFDTLAAMSSLADATLACAYRIAVQSVAASHPPEQPGYEPRSRMMVIALGRLGMKEFDLASDADLVFVVPDEDMAEDVFWTRAAERMINVITAYTGDGVIFAVDTRLRPNGREGALVQSESAFKEYFAYHAEAWEGITYMKSRAVAGDIERGTVFLGELQKVDWRRYGQSGRSRKQLYQMRQRLEKEQGTANRLKAGFGGYYDIDFALMYLRLKGAGIFFKVLNTPQRIDVIEQMGHLERPDADFLRDAAIFYRALDHGLRLITGHAEGTLPESPAQLKMLADLVTRWTPDHLHDQELPVELTQIQARTREYFDRLFQ